MDTILNPIAVPGWAQLLREHPTRARVLQALTNLELGYYFGQKPALPTRKTILAEAIRLGADISPTSQQTVQRHLDELAEAGHVVKLSKGRSPGAAVICCCRPSKANLMFFSMPYLPEVSVNHSHTRSRTTGRPIKKPEAKKWQSVLAAQVRTWADAQHVSLPPGGHVVIWLTAEFPKQGGTRPNADNFLKIAQDAIAEGLGTDDDIYPFRARVKSESYDQPPHQGNLHYEVLINAQDI